MHFYSWYFYLVAWGRNSGQPKAGILKFNSVGYNAQYYPLKVNNESDFHIVNCHFYCYNSNVLSFGLPGPRRFGTIEQKTALLLHVCSTAFRPIPKAISIRPKKRNFSYLQ
jgi:hypothetical protein